MENLLTSAQDGGPGGSVQHDVILMFLSKHGTKVIVCGVKKKINLSDQKSSENGLNPKTFNSSMTDNQFRITKCHVVRTLCNAKEGNHHQILRKQTIPALNNLC